MGCRLQNNRLYFLSFVIRKILLAGIFSMRSSGELDLHQSIITNISDLIDDVVRCTVPQKRLIVAGVEALNKPERQISLGR
jgi:hypothetical protein